MFSYPSIRSPTLAGAILSVMLALLGCGGSGGTAFVYATGTVSQLYVSGVDGNRLLIYNDANSATGSPLPNQTVTGGLTTLNGLRGIALDMARDQIYIANAMNNSILVFHNARAVTGGVAPNRTITGASLNRPSALFFDAVSNRLFVVNTTGNSILIYDNASTLNGSVAPNRTLTGIATMLNAPLGIYVDVTRNLLYVSNSTNQILVFSNAATVTGNVSPVRAIGGLSSPTGIFTDVMTDRLYVVNTGANAILVFNGASTANGAPVPDRILSGGGTLLNLPREVFVDSGRDRMYVSNDGGNSVLVYNGASTVNGNTAPSRNLTLTASSGAWGIFVDVTPIVIGSTSTLDGFITFDGTTYTAQANGGGPRTGDDETFLAGSRARQFFSFNLSNLPASITIVQATLRLYQASQVGTPYNDLGVVVVDHVNYGATLDSSPGGYDSGLILSLGNLSTGSAIGYKTLDVTARVVDDVSNARGHSQYRLRFSPNEINTDFASDYVQFTDAEDSCCGVNRPPQLAITIQP
jgi:DNA-binding beta-propeller fold protein YncE